MMTQTIRFAAAVLVAALIVFAGITISLAEETSDRPIPVYIAALGDQPTRVAHPPGDLVSIARSFEGRRGVDLGLPHSLWCADFVNLVRRRAGLRPVPSRLARDQAMVGRHLASPRVGAIAVLSRGVGRRAGHTGIIAAVDGHHLVLVAGTTAGGRVVEETVSRSRLVAVVDPT